MALGKEMGRAGKQGEAGELLRGLRPALVAAHGELSTQTAALHKILASLALEQGVCHKMQLFLCSFWMLQISGNSLEAVRELKKVLSIQKEVLGKENKRTQATAKALHVLLKNPNLRHLKDVSVFCICPSFPC